MGKHKSIFHSNLKTNKNKVIFTKFNRKKLNLNSNKFSNKNIKKKWYVNIGTRLPFWKKYNYKIIKIKGFLKFNSRLKEGKRKKITLYKKSFKKVFFRSIIFLNKSLKNRKAKASLAGIVKSGAFIWRLFINVFKPHNGCKAKKIRRL